MLSEATIFRDTATALSSGGDGRQDLDIDGQNRYGCNFSPVSALVEYGSCTGSTVGSRGFDVADSLRLDLEAAPIGARLEDVAQRYEQVRSRILRSLVGDSRGTTDVVITPSGTDAELIPLALVAARGEERIVNIVVGPLEVGSGTVAATSGRVFDSSTPNGAHAQLGSAIDPQLASRVEIETVPLRDEHGSARTAEEMDAEISQIVARAIADGARVLLHQVAHSKTGVHAPTIGCVARLKAEHGPMVAVLIDAAQGRASRRGLRASLAQGSMVLTTGSKFFGGPSFSGAVLVPPQFAPQEHFAFSAGFGRYFSRQFFPTSWEHATAELPDEPNVGLLLRWEAALAEVEAYYATDPAHRLLFLRAFERLAAEALSASAFIDVDAVDPLFDDEQERLLESKTTVFPFRVSDRHGRLLDKSGLLELHAALNADLSEQAGESGGEVERVLGRKFHLGQPVVVGPNDAAMLRVAAGAPMITDLAVSASWGAALHTLVDSIESDLSDLVAKLEILLQTEGEESAR